MRAKKRRKPNDNATLSVPSLFRFLLLLCFVLSAFRLRFAFLRSAFPRLRPLPFSSAEPLTLSPLEEALSPVDPLYFYSYKSLIRVL